MITPSRFDLENQLLDRLDDQHMVTWLRMTDTLKRTLLLAGGFMDVEVMERNVHEIHEFLQQCPPNSPSAAAPSQPQKSAKP